MGLNLQPITNLLGISELIQERSWVAEHSFLLVPNKQVLLEKQWEGVWKIIQYCQNNYKYPLVLFFPLTFMNIHASAQPDKLPQFIWL